VAKTQFLINVMPPSLSITRGSSIRLNKGRRGGEE